MVANPSLPYIAVCRCHGHGCSLQLAPRLVVPQAGEPVDLGEDVISSSPISILPNEDHTLEESR